MKWKINFTKKASKQFFKLDRKIREQIIYKLKEIEKLENPRTIGKALVANYKGLWRYRVGDWRLICLIEEKKIVILVLEVGHRKEIYKRIQ